MKHALCALLLVLTFATPAFARDTEHCTFEKGMTTCTVVTTRTQELSVPTGSGDGFTDDGSLVARYCRLTAPQAQVYSYSSDGGFTLIMTVEHTTTTTQRGAPGSHGKQVSTVTAERDISVEIGDSDDLLSLDCFIF